MRPIALQRISIFYKTILLYICLISFSCQKAPKQSQLIDKDYSENFIHGNQVLLHYLDWGGSGQPLILIHGLSDTPFLFEDLALSLKNNFRVIAYSRRGHCKSQASDDRYDNAALVSDLKLLLDSLKISKANLLGWSMGGNEITEFAIRYPEQTNKLIYFEAGYDLSEEAFRKMIAAMPNQPFADSSALSSLDAYRRWYHKFWFPDIEWNTTLELNLQASVHINADGSVSPLPNDEASKNTLQFAMSYHRPYEKVSAPALVFFTNSFFHAPERDSSLAAAYVNLEKEIIEPWRKHSMNRIKTELKDATINMLPKGSHVSLIFESKDEIVSAINTFLLQ